MRSYRITGKFRMELSSDEKWVGIFRKLYKLHEATVRRSPRKDEAGLFKLLYVFGINLISMSMSFVYFFCLIFAL